MSRSIFVSSLLLRLVPPPVQQDIEAKIREVMSKGTPPSEEDVKNILSIIGLGKKEATSKKEEPFSEEYIKLGLWWRRQTKLQITDYKTKASATFAYVDKKIFTPTKFEIGKIVYWKDEKIPQTLKNDEGIVLEPKSHCYLTQIVLDPRYSHLHCLPKKKYSKYNFIRECGLLRKSYEIEYLK